MRVDQTCELLVSCTGGAECWHNSGQCWCKDGECAGAGNICHQGDYVRLNGTYTVSPSRWPDWYMYMDWDSGAEVSKSTNDQGEFYIEVLHEPGNAGVYVRLISRKWDNRCLYMAELPQDDGTNYYELESREIDKDDVTVQNSALRLRLPPQEDPDPSSGHSLVMIQGVDFPKYAVVPNHAYIVEGHDQDEGAGMYWYIKPALPAALYQELHPYVGPQCNKDCGDVEVSRGVRGGVSAPAFLLWVCWSLAAMARSALG